MVADPDSVRQRLLAAGAQPGFAGLMLDRRFDRGGELLARDEVLRLRVFRNADGAETFHLGWKGPTGVTPDGYKARRELEYELEPSGPPPHELLEALGYMESLRIDRYVEYFHLAGTAVRLEWYPRMDVLMEIEGEREGIEAAREASGIPRAEFTAEPLALFAARFAARTGQAPVLALDLPGAEPPAWPPR